MTLNTGKNLLRLRRMVRCLSSSLGLLLLAGSTGFAHVQQANHPNQIGIEIGNALTETLEDPRAYNPPPNSQANGSGATGGGIRGCGSEMVAIAPQFAHVGRSFSTRPTFVWYMGNTTTGTLRFALYPQGEDISVSPMFSEDLELPQSGYVAYTIPEGAELAAGEAYTWRAILYCEDNVGRWISADIKIVAPSEAALTSEDTAEHTFEDATTYAALGYWYDALAIVYDGENSDEQALRQNMLLDLADLEAGSDSAIAARRSNRLRMLAETP